MIGATCVRARSCWPSSSASPPATNARPAVQGRPASQKPRRPMAECKKRVGLDDVATPSGNGARRSATRGQEMTPDMAGQLRLKAAVLRLELNELLAAVATRSDPASPSPRFFALALSAEGADMKLTLATATPGGGFPVYGDAVIAAIRECRSDAPSSSRQRQHEGQHRERALLEKNESGTVALVQGEVAYEALRAWDAPPHDPHRGRECTPRPACSSCARTRRRGRSEDLRGKPVAFGRSRLGARAARPLRAGRSRSRPGARLPRPSISSAPATVP